MFYARIYELPSALDETPVFIDLIFHTVVSVVHFSIYQSGTPSRLYLFGKNIPTKRTDCSRFWTLNRTRTPIYLTIVNRRIE